VLDVVLVEPVGAVVLVDPGPVVEVVVSPATVVVVDEDGVEVVVVLVVVVVLEVVVVVGAGRVVVGLLTKIRSTVVPPFEWPKRSASGRPATSSTTVTRTRVATKTAATAAATAGHRMAEGTGGSDGGLSIGSDATSCVSAPDADALVAVSSASDDPATGVASVTPVAVVPPSPRSNRVCSGTRTTTCFTAWLVRSIDWKTRALPVVAATEPMATPMMVPSTPKKEAITADSTAPAAEAKICL
jgi:hypothetical protein